IALLFYPGPAQLGRYHRRRKLTAYQYRQSLFSTRLPYSFHLEPQPSRDVEFTQGRRVDVFHGYAWHYYRRAASCVAYSFVAPGVVGGAGPDEVWRGLGTLAGSWIGGSANQAALREILQP